MTENVTILVASMTGTAELVAEEMEAVLTRRGVTVEMLKMDHLNAQSLTGGLYLICTSTYGKGDVPDGGKAFFTALETERPDLSNVRFGVFGLGDSKFLKTFNFGGKKFESLFESLGAVRIGERFAHDASSGDLPDEMAVDWVARWYDLVLENS